MSRGFEKKVDAIVDFLNQEYPEFRKILEKEPKLAQKLAKQCRDTECTIPLSIFRLQGLGSLELSVLYLRDQCGLANSEVARALGRSRQVVHRTYTLAKQKFPGKLPVKKGSFDIPVSVFSSTLGPLESITLFLKGKELSFSEIAKRLFRDQRTIWTTYHRAIRKVAK